MLKIMGKKILQFYAENFRLSKPMVNDRRKVKSKIHQYLINSIHTLQLSVSRMWTKCQLNIWFNSSFYIRKKAVLDQS